MGLLSDINRLLIALSLQHGVGRQRIKAIFSNDELSASPDFNVLQTHLNSICFASIQQFLGGAGDVYSRVLLIEEQCNNFGITMLNYEDANYPFLLKQVPDYPLYLFVKGDVGVLHKDQIAIVGSRNASSAGLRHAYDFARGLSQNELVVTSGMALGVDSAAHAGAIDAGFSSIAVMGTGLDTVYPKRNHRLAHRLLDKGCWVSEYLPGSAPVAANFPRRNRIISGLALGVLVVEARMRSGTLITAKAAIEQNREVFALPGPIEYQGSAGCHDLISQGAKLVQHVDDILIEIKPQVQPLSLLQDIIPVTLEPALAALLDNIQFQPMQFSEIAKLTSIGQADLISMLVELELHGCIENNVLGINRIK